MRVRLPNKLGEQHWVEMHAQALQGPDGGADGFITKFRGVDERVRIESELEQRARFDDLTGAAEAGRGDQPPDARSVESASRRGDWGVLFIDIDEFKGVNDRRGHATGDDVCER